MKSRAALIPITAVLGFAAQPAFADHHMDGTMPHAIEASVIDTQGKAIGTVKLKQTPSGVLISTDISGLPAGEHGFHLHEKGVCDASDGFKTAGGHFNPTGHDHGLMTDGGPHAGDMPNQHVGTDGMLKTQVLDTAVTLHDGEGSVADADGTALVIHADPDDYTSQPSGNAGSRIACAVISAPSS